MKIIFDVDGTLFNAGTVALPAFQAVLKHYNQQIPSDSVLLNTLGYPIVEIWEMLLPGMGKERHTEASALMNDFEERLMYEGKGELFPEVKNTLTQLFEQGHELYTLSNCDEPYLHTVIEVFNLKPLFKGLHCAGMYPGETKAQILKRILQGDSKALMVGDRFHDIEAGVVNNIPTVWCNYGFSQQAEIKNQDYTVSSFGKILEIVHNLSNQKE